MAFKRTTKKDESDVTVSPTPKKKTGAVKKPALPPTKKLSELKKSTTEEKALEPTSVVTEEEQLELPLEEPVEEPSPVVEEPPMIENIEPSPPPPPVDAKFKMRDTMPVTSVKVKEAPLWRKKPRTGDHRMRDGTVVTGTMVIKAWPEELAGVMDKFVRLTPALDGDHGGPPTPNATLFVKERDGGGYDVVNDKDVPINATSLTKEEADSLVNGITA